MLSHGTKFWALWSKDLSYLIAAGTNISHINIAYRLIDRRTVYAQSWKHTGKQNNMELVRVGQWKFLVWGEARGRFLEVEDCAKHSEYT